MVSTAGLTTDRRPGGVSAGLQSVIDSERQPPCADLGGAGDGEHSGADNRPPGRAGLQSVIDSERRNLVISSKGRILWTVRPLGFGLIAFVSILVFARLQQTWRHARATLSQWFFRIFQ